MLRLREALRGNAEDTSRYLGVYTMTVPFEEFYAPENVRRMLAA
jgi:hypothetical protein